MCFLTSQIELHRILVAGYIYVTGKDIISASKTKVFLIFPEIIYEICFAYYYNPFITHKAAILRHTLLQYYISIHKQLQTIAVKSNYMQFNVQSSTLSFLPISRLAVTKDITINNINKLINNIKQLEIHCVICNKLSKEIRKSSDTFDEKKYKLKQTQLFIDIVKSKSFINTKTKCCSNILNKYEAKYYPNPIQFVIKMQLFSLWNYKYSYDDKMFVNSVIDKLSSIKIYESDLIWSIGENKRKEYEKEYFTEAAQHPISYISYCKGIEYNIVEGFAELLVGNQSINKGSYMVLMYLCDLMIDEELRTKYFELQDGLCCRKWSIRGIKVLPFVLISINCIDRKYIQLCDEQCKDNAGCW